MNTRTIFRKTIMVAALTFVMVGYQNCGKIPLLGGSTKLSSEQPLSPQLAPQDYLSEPAPDLICGEAGYAYLMRNYLVKNCGSCHDGKANLNTLSFANAQDTKGSYAAAKLVSKAEFISTSTANRFCGTSCSISAQGATFQALSEWLDHKNCP